MIVRASAIIRSITLGDRRHVVDQALDLAQPDDVQ